MENLFGWFQLVALSTYLMLFVGRSAQLGIGHRVRVFTLAVNKGGVEAAREILFLVGFPLWIYLVLATSGPLDLPTLPQSLDPVLVSGIGFDIGGAVLQAAAVSLFAWSLASFGASWRVGIDTSGSGGLITRGAFRWSRNPIFLSLDLLAVGAFLVAGQLSLFLFAVVMLIGMHIQIRAEERFLAGHYGRAYHDYRACVGRYLGRAA